MSAREHLSGNESEDPRFLSVICFFRFYFCSGETGGKEMCLRSNKTFSFAEREGFHLCLSIRIISISKVGRDFEMKIETVPSPKAEVGCFDRLFFFFFFTSRALLPGTNISLQRALHLTSSNSSPAKTSP